MQIEGSENRFSELVEFNASRPLFPAAGIARQLASEEQTRLQRVLSEPLEYLNHATFFAAKVEKTLFGEALDETEKAARPWCNSADALRASRSCVAASTTLTTPQEQRLFLRLNYARFRMAEIFRAHSAKRLPVRAARELLWWHSQVEAVRCEIVRSNLPLVLAMAKRTRLGNVDYAELISEGNMALLRSADKFDCSRGFKFSTYACRAILKSFSRVAMRASRYRGHFPTEFDPSLERSDYQDQQRQDVEFDCIDELRDILRTNTADLNDVEVKVLQARFALGQAIDEQAPKTLEQVGMLIGVTKERVRQIQNRALAKLREKLEEDFLAA